jgi:diguanylate cyclase (GGDEF)-like protein/PAS domain S-box-containing protein
MADTTQVGASGEHDACSVIAGHPCGFRRERSAVTTGENVRLLIVEESASDAESLANELRNAGHSLTFEHLASGDELAASLEQKIPDIIICGSGSGLPDTQQLGSILEQHADGPAVIAIADDASEAEVIGARKCGITELVSYQHPEHLRMVFDRLIETIRLRHKMSRLEKKLLDGESRCHALIENSSDAIAYIHDGMHVYANPPYLKLFGVETPEEIAGMPVLDTISTEARDSFREVLKSDIENAESGTSIDIDCVSPQEGKFSCTMECSPATMAGESCMQILVRVHSSHSELEERIKTLSQKDTLTGLLNRQHFMQILEQRIGHRPRNRQRALMYITLDNFKTIRDEVGIAASDAVLCDLSSLIAANCNQEDTLSRFGDYSFTILKQEADKDAIRHAGEELLGAIAGHLYEAGGRSFSLSASIGICTINEHTRDVQELISYADMACEVARTSGGNQIHTHSSVVADSMELNQQEEWGRIISSTIQDQRFYLVFQPIVSLRGDTMPRYEVLLRILDESGHTILPGQFLSIAESFGMGRDIDCWIINQACTELVELRKSSGNAAFYIKLSAATLADDEMPTWIRDKLQEHGLDGSGVVFEIPAQAVASNLKGAQSFVNTVQAIGCKVALEHIGCSGNLQMLNHVPAEIIKIDSSLVTRLASDKEAQETVKAIIDMAKKSNKACIAENVEDSNCLARLWQIGMHFIQGNFIQEPSKEMGYIFESELA